MKRLLLPLLLVAATAGCRSAAITFQAGNNGEFETRISIDENAVVVTGKDGRLLINGEDRGPIHEGDKVTVYSNGAVRVNGHSR